MRKLTSLRSLTLVALLWGSISNLNGQALVTALGTHVTGDPAEVVKVEIKVVDFESMLNSQFTLRYDTAILNFSAVGDFGIFNINSQNFGIPNGPFPTPKGVISFLWIADNIITGQSLPDSTVLFTVSFEIIGTAGQVCPIQFSGDPTDVEFGNLGGEMPYAVYDGSVTVAGGVATEEIVTEDFTFFPISPNPIQEEARISFSLSKASKVQLNIHDSSGKSIYRDSKYYGGGMQAITLKKEVFPAPGAYFVSITTERAQAVQKLIVVR
ncbi:MAG: T9SS type A sorting domain-containing protein [Saprospirales bacterium]|nr:T9SS type A sorting domain-containing protein [Saprospirales bacterium]